MKVTIVDYGIGNLFSIRKGLERVGASVDIVSDMRKIKSAECLVFPGVGAFGEAMRKLGNASDEIRESLSSGTPALGICLGMQILHECSEESDEKGLSFIRGGVTRIDAERVPQMGWNNVRFKAGEPLFEGVDNGAQFYYANTYTCKPEEGAILAETTYGRDTFAAALRKNSVFGVQFHPEKSSNAGLKVLENFMRIVGGK